MAASAILVAVFDRPFAGLEHSFKSAQPALIVKSPGQTTLVFDLRGDPAFQWDREYCPITEETIAWGWRHPVMAEIDENCAIIDDQIEHPSYDHRQSENCGVLILAGHPGAGQAWESGSVSQCAVMRNILRRFCARQIKTAARKPSRPAWSARKSRHRRCIRSTMRQARAV